MRTPDYYLNCEKTRDKAVEILDKSGLAYFVAVQEKDEKKKAYSATTGKIGDSNYSYQLVLKATVACLKEYSKTRQVELLKFIGKKLGYKIEVTE